MEGKSDDRSICHCRMCQKAFGNFYAPLVNTRGVKFEWTRGEPRRWRSSNHVLRGFCEKCGTPLTYEAEDGLAVAIGAFDHPELLTPIIQYGVESKIEWLDDLDTLPARHTMDDIDTAPFLDDIDSHQHPDHDTNSWPEPEDE
nr:GFA family protein [Salaquimonas pukyongi]